MILVVGATGILGGEICRRLIDRGQSVRALTRTSSDVATVEGLCSARAEIVQGNLLGPASLQAQFDGASDSRQRSFSSLMLSYAKGDPIDMGQARHDFPFTLTSVREYAERVLTS